MCEDAADALREALDGERTASDAWSDQQSVNDSVAVSPSETIETDLADDSPTGDLTEVVSEAVESRSGKSDV